VNSVVYCDGKRIADIAINDIGEAIRQAGTFVWIGTRWRAPTMTRPCSAWCSDQRGFLFLDGDGDGAALPLQKSMTCFAASAWTDAT
jgi:hypothetical protein